MKYMMVNFPLAELDPTQYFLLGKLRTWSFAVYTLILITIITDSVFFVSGDHIQLKIH